MKKLYWLIVVAFLATITSCITPSQVNYLQDMHHGSQIELEQVFQAKISPYDELDIHVYASSEELARPFNIGGVQNMANVSSNHQGQYLVDIYGNIQFPVLGTIHVANMTRLELQDTIKNRLIQGNLLNDAVVMVRFANFKIFFLGAEGGKSITISNERCTFLEALALAGDLNLYTNRNKIAVMREVNGKMEMRFLDPRSSSVFQDPFFMLQQNDFIITQKYTKETPRNEARNVSSWISIIMSFLTFGITIFGYVTNTRN